MKLPHEKPAVRLTLVRESRAKYEPAKVSSPAVVARLFAPLETAPSEEVWVAILDTKHCIVSTVLAHRGGLAQSLVEPRAIFAPALLANASAVILVHNHPSGDPTPSSHDHDLTRRIKLAGELLGIPLLDHVVIGSSGTYRSLAEGNAL